MRPSRLLPAVTVLGALALAGPAQAADTYVVQRLDDAADTCAGTTDRDCTLRSALAKAAAGTTEAVVELAPGTYPVASTLTVDDGNGGAVTVRGRGFGATTITRGGGPSSVVTFTGGALTLRGMTITGGSSTRGGGGIAGTGGDLTLSDVRLTGNAAPDRFGNGGGLFFTSGRLVVQRSVIDRNTTGGGGGGISAATPGPGVNITIRDTVFTQNTAGAQTGGAALEVYDGNASVQQSTIVANTGATAITGGRSLLISLTRSIVDHGATGCYRQSVVDAGANLDAGASCATTPGSRANVALRLAPGALVPAPLPGSPAIDAVDPGSCTTDDARGVQRRPIDGDVDGVARCDIGAVEYTPGVPRFAEATADASSASVAVDTVGGDAAQTVWVEYGTETTYGSATEAIGVPAGQAAARVTIPVTGLAPATTYHLRVVGSDGVSTSRGADQTVTTAPAPPAPVETPAGGVAGETGSGGTPPPPAARFTVKLAEPGALSLRRPPARGLMLRVTCSAACRFTTELRVSRTVAKRLGLRSVVLARVAGTGTAGKAKTVRVKLPRGLARKLRAGKVAWAAVRVAAKPTTGGRTRTATGAVTLRRR